MASPFIQSVFDSRSSSPQLPYQAPAYVKDESLGLMGQLVPFPSPEKSLDADLFRQQLETGAILLTDLAADAFTGPSFLASDTLSTSENSSFGSEGTLEVDNAFLNQISCFSDLPGILLGSSRNPFLNPSSFSQLVSTTTQAPDIATNSVLCASTPLSNKTKKHQGQIFSCNIPRISSIQPPGTEDWVEWTGTVTICGHSVSLGGWEPPEDDKYPLADINFTGWTPYPLMFLPNDPGWESEPSKQSVLETKGFADSKARRAEASKSWARRVTSNKPIPEPRKKRRVETVLPMQVNATVEENTLPMSMPTGQCLKNEVADERPARNVEETKLSCSLEELAQAQEESGSKANASPRFTVPEYVYPLPEVAKAITLRAAEDERARALATNLRLQEEAQEEENDTVDEETRQLMNEFLIFPEDLDAKEQCASNAPPSDNPFTKAFDPSCLPSPTSATSIGVKQGLRPTRSHLDYSASTRRRALVRFRSETLGRGAVPLSQKGENDNLVAKNSVEGGPGTVPQSKRCNVENGNTLSAQRTGIRVRVS